MLHISLRLKFRPETKDMASITMETLIVLLFFLTLVR